jgi:hypothetical protein
MGFPCFSPRLKNERRRVNDLRHLLEKRMACALQIAKQADYSPKQRSKAHRAGPHKSIWQVGRFSADMGGLGSDLVSDLKVPTYRQAAGQHGRQLKGFHHPGRPGNCLKWRQRSFS